MAVDAEDRAMLDDAWSACPPGSFAGWGITALEAVDEAAAGLPAGSWTPAARRAAWSLLLSWQRSAGVFGVDVVEDVDGLVAELVVAISCRVVAGWRQDDKQPGTEGQP